MSAIIYTPPTKAAVREFLSCLSKLKKSRKLTIAQLADYVNVNRSTLSRWMTKKSTPSSEMMDLKYSILNARAENMYDEGDDIKEALPESFHNRFVDEL